jgi:hypothetical protein
VNILDPTGTRTRPLGRSAHSRFTDRTIARIFWTLGRCLPHRPPVPVWGIIPALGGTTSNPSPGNSSPVWYLSLRPEYKVGVSEICAKLNKD